MSCIGWIGHPYCFAYVFSPRRQESDEDIERKARSCYVGNLSWDTDEAQLSAYCAGVGEVVNCVIMRRGRRSTGSALVEFADVATAQKAVATLNGTELEGRSIIVREDRVAEQPEVYMQFFFA